MEAAYTVGPCHYRRIKFTGTLRLWAKYSLHFMDIWIWKKTYYTIQLGLIVTQSSVYYSWLYWNCIIRGPCSSFEWKQNSNTATQYEAWSFYKHIVHYICINKFTSKLLYCFVLNTLCSISKQLRTFLVKILLVTMFAERSGFRVMHSKDSNLFLSI